MRLIHILQQSDEDELVQLLRRFRGTSSMDALKYYINGQPYGDLSNAPGYIDSNNPTLERMKLRLRCTALSRNLGRLHREPIYNVHSIHRWTSATDNATASHLLSFYFSWDHQVWRFLDPELFIQDLNAGRCRFCSRLLLHTVLLYACVRPAYAAMRTCYRPILTLIIGLLIRYGTAMGQKCRESTFQSTLRADSATMAT